VFNLLKKIKLITTLQSDLQYPVSVKGGGCFPIQGAQIFLYLSRE